MAIGPDTAVLAFGLLAGEIGLVGSGVAYVRE
jgi:hypothetical protein